MERHLRKQMQKQTDQLLRLDEQKDPLGFFSYQLKNYFTGLGTAIVSLESVCSIELEEIKTAIEQPIVEQKKLLTDFLREHPSPYLAALKGRELLKSSMPYRKKQSASQAVWEKEISNQLFPSGLLHRALVRLGISKESFPVFVYYSAGKSCLESYYAFPLSLPLQEAILEEAQSPDTPDELLYFEILESKKNPKDTLIDLHV